MNAQLFKTAQCTGKRGREQLTENLDLMMRNSRPAFACKLSAVQFYKLLGQEGFLVTSKDLYQSCLLQNIIHVLISAALGGNVL